jgi:hypothetical protein
MPRGGRRSTSFKPGDELISHSNSQSVEILTLKVVRIGCGGHMANSNPGNGILRPETFGEMRHQWTAETAE